MDGVIQDKAVPWGRSFLSVPIGTFPTLGLPGHLSSRWGKSLDTMLTDLESAINSLIDVYHNYSLLKGNYHAVYRDDLKRLLETECPKFLKVRRAWVWLGFLAWL